ncbi:MAG: hypothetical protein ACJAZT_000092 [Gammaproteobacteria bacterium]|jgi:hypothetical protein
MQNTSDIIILGWREWISLPQLNLPAVKAKIDTGAKTSALHAFYVKPYQKESVDMVKFLIHPIQANANFPVECHAAVIDQRKIADSGGHKEMRYVIESMITIGDRSWPIELSLTNRDTMRFRMLLGRRAMGSSALVEPGASYLHGKLNPQTLYNL